MPPEEAKTFRREQKRLETRERLLRAAAAEYARSGSAKADLTAIVSAAGVARSTFNLHFPTKEHVLAELVAREEKELASVLGDLLDSCEDLRSGLLAIAESVSSMEGKLGSTLFREVLALYFSPNNPEIRDPATHPVVEVATDLIVRFAPGDPPRDEPDLQLRSVYFLLGLYGLLVTLENARNERRALLVDYVDTYCFGLLAR